MDRLKKNLDIVFIGFNPSLMSGEVGHHYANRTNRFWRILYEAGITDRLYHAEEDDTLLNKGMGFTNIVSRPTKAADEISSEEYKIGREILLDKMAFFQPKVAFFVGKGVYLQYTQKKKANWGLQVDQTIKGIIDFVAPSSSGLVRMKIKDIVSIYSEVLPFLGK